MQANQRKGLVHLHSAVLLFGGTALFAKLLPLAAVDLTFYRIAIACIVLVTLIKWQGKALFVNVKETTQMALLGVIMAGHWVTYFYAIQSASVAIGILSLFTYPIFTVLWLAVLERKKPCAKDVIATLVVLFGIYLMLPGFDLANSVTLGIASGLVSAVLFASRNVWQKRLLSHYSGPHAMALQTLFACLIILPFVGTPVSAITNHTWLLLLVAGSLFTALPHALFANAIRALTPTTVAVVSCMQPFWGTILAAIVLMEWPAMLTVIGGSLIVGTALFETLSSQKRG